MDTQTLKNKSPVDRGLQKSAASPSLIEHCRVLRVERGHVGGAARRRVSSSSPSRYIVDGKQPCAHVSCQPRAAMTRTGGERYGVYRDTLAWACIAKGTWETVRDTSCDPWTRHLMVGAHTNCRFWLSGDDAQMRHMRMRGSNLPQPPGVTKVLRLPIELPRTVVID